jgi:hypothetical protein
MTPSIPTSHREYWWIACDPGESARFPPATLATAARDPAYSYVAVLTAELSR